MTGPEHYVEAERLLVRPPGTITVIAALAHATLAAVAALVADRSLGPVEAWGGQHFETDPKWKQVTDQ